jgi:hypothetical protein
VRIDTRWAPGDADRIRKNAVELVALVSGATEKHPTRKGISIRVALLPRLIAALRVAEIEACRIGLLADAKAADRRCFVSFRHAVTRVAVPRQRIRKADQSVLPCPVGKPGNTRCVIVRRAAASQRVIVSTMHHTVFC